MQISLRVLFLLVTVVVIVFGLVVHSLSTMNFDFGSEGNDISFRDAETALIASNQHLEWKYDSVLITVDGTGVYNSQDRKNVAQFNIKIRGKYKRSIPDLRPIWPLTRDELAKMIESKLEATLGPDSKPKCVTLIFPYGDLRDNKMKN